MNFGLAYGSVGQFAAWNMLVWTFDDFNKMRLTFETCIVRNLCLMYIELILNWYWSILPMWVHIGACGPIWGHGWPHGPGGRAGSGRGCTQPDACILAQRAHVGPIGPATHIPTVREGPGLFYKVLIWGDLSLSLYIYIYTCIYL